MLDPAIDAAFFSSNSFLEELLSPSPEEIYFRTVMTLVICLSSFLFNKQLNKISQQHHALDHQKQLIQNIIDSEPECVKTVAKDGTLLDMNPAGLNIVEAPSITDVRYASVYDLIAPEDREAYIEFNRRIFNGEKLQMQYDVVGLEGTRKRVDSHAAPLYDENGNIIAHLAITRDITEFQKNQEELAKFSLAVEQCASMVMITNPEGIITYVNPRFCEVTGYTKEEFLGQNPNLLSSGKHSDAFYTELWEKINTGSEWRGQIQNKCKNGELYWAAIVISPISDEEGNTTHFLCTQEDITASHMLTEKLEYQASHCLLTGLVNRHKFELQLEQILEQAKQDQSEHAIVFADIDQFKQINDTCGHAAGDQLLRQISNIIQSCVRQNDLVSRLGGDEFAVLIRHCEKDKAGKVVEHIRQAVEDFTFLWENQSFKVTISIGWLTLDQYSPDSSVILSQADASCYIAKEQGRNRIHLHHESGVSESRKGEYQWITRIHEGLEKHRFELYAQKIKPLKQGLPPHYEVLLRYIDEEGNIIPPGAFLPSAERYGISPKIDRWVVLQTCHLLTSDLVDTDISLSVNLSGLSVNDPDFLSYIKDCLSEFSVPCERICFEITETATITNLAEAVNFIHEMKSFGCKFALDDFGSGLSSFGYLKTLPVDYVKIDGIFVKNMTEEPIDHAMVKSINEIGQLMGKLTVAEFVEDHKSEEQLSGLGVDYA
ncbi:MAG: EAL domain-containing protein [Neptuniibacter sp.]